MGVDRALFAVILVGQKRNGRLFLVFALTANRIRKEFFAVLGEDLPFFFDLRRARAFRHINHPSFQQVSGFHKLTIKHEVERPITTVLHIENIQ